MGLRQNSVIWHWETHKINIHVFLTSWRLTTCNLPTSSRIWHMLISYQPTTRPSQSPLGTSRPLQRRLGCSRSFRIWRSWAFHAHRPKLLTSLLSKMLQVQVMLLKFLAESRRQLNTQEIAHWQLQLIAAKQAWNTKHQPERNDSHPILHSSSNKWWYRYYAPEKNAAARNVNE